MAAKKKAKKPEQPRLFTVGPNTQFVLHRADMVNYWPGQKFNLDHVRPEIVQKMIDRGQVVDVTEMSDKEIGELVGGYKGISQERVLELMRQHSG